MSTHLSFSNRLERLAQRLADHLEHPSPGRDPFAPATVIVPNQNLKKWLQLYLAEAHGVSINLRFPFLERGLWEILNGLREPDSPAVDLLDSDRLRAFILAILEGGFQRFDSETREALSPLEDYLWHEGDPRPNQARRAWQLAERLARFFLEYGYHRQEMIAAWLAGQLSPQRGDTEPNDRRMERCQMTLYRLIFGPDGVRERLETPDQLYRTLPEFSRLVLDRAQPPPAGTALPPLHIFGLSQISTFHGDLLYRLAAWHNLHLYQMNVCAEYWEDVETPAETRWWERVRDGKVLTDANGEELSIDGFENPLLRWWGRAGRETLKLLTELEAQSSSEAPFETDWLAEPPPLSPPRVLTTLQAQIFARRSALPRHPPQPDTSLQIIGCPGLFREVETVYQSILHNMAVDDTLQFSDIAVLVPNIAEYQPVIRSVFGRRDRQVLYNLSDLTAAEDSIFGQGVLQLLQLANSTVSRHDLFQLLLNPCFLAARDLSREDVEIWLKWADNLNVFHCLDRDDKCRRGYPDTLLHTWSQALRRLRLGRLMQAPQQDDPRQPPAHLAGLAPYEDLDSHDPERLGAFCLILESLFARLRALRRGNRDGATWRELVASLVTDFLEVPEEAPWERQVKTGLLEGLQELEQMDTLLVAAQPQPPALQLGFVIELVQGCLSGIASRHGNYLSGGVNISSLRPMRPVPFRIVYILGLGEGKFPAEPEAGTLDLRQRYRRLGDVSRPDEDRYLFLETLASVRDKLYLTYVNRDIVKDKDFHPCTVLNQLLRYLHTHLQLPDFPLQHMPLHSHSQRYFQPNPSPAGDALINYDDDDRLLATLQACYVHDSLTPPPEHADHLRQATSLLRLPPGDPPDDEPEVVTLWELKNFLLNPREVALRRHLRIATEEVDDRMLADYPPLQLELRSERRMTRDILEDLFALSVSERQADPRQLLDILVDRHTERATLAGAMPDGPYTDLARENLRRLLHDRLNGFGACKDQPLAKLLDDLRCARLSPPWIMGPPSQQARPGSRIVQPLELQLDVDGTSRRVLLQGSLPLSWRHETTTDQHILVIDSGKAVSRNGIPPRQILQSWLFMLAAQLHGPDLPAEESLAKQLGGRPFTLQLTHREGISRTTYSVSPEQARMVLTNLLHDLLSPRCFDLLPYNLITDSYAWAKHLGKRQLPSEEEQEALRDELLETVEAHRQPTTWSSWYPPAELFLLPSEIPDNAWQLLLQRLDLLLQGTTS